MRDAFFEELKTVFEENPKTVFITGDLGYKLWDPLAKIDPARVINFGIRENAMVGFASGLAKEGYLPFIYSIVPFITLRSLEQIKVDLCYNKARVVVVGVGGGFAYGPNGPTHYGIEDLGLLSSLPKMTVWSPCDPNQVRQCVREAEKLEGPAYLRLGRNKEPNLARSQSPSGLALPEIVQAGKNGTIVTSGFILDEVLKAAALLKKDGLNPQILHLATLRPFPTEAIAQHLAALKGPVLSVEEHVANGGLGAEVARVIAMKGLKTKLDMACIPSEFPDVCLDREAALAWSGIDAASIAQRFRRLMDDPSNHGT